MGMAAPTTTEEYKYVKVRCVGGEIPGATLSQKIGPLGLPPKVVGEDIRKNTQDYKGLKVNLALKEPPRDRKKEKNIVHDGSITIEDVVDIARLKHPKSHSKSLVGTIKQVLGTAVSIGCKVDGKSPKEVIQEINSGELSLPTE